MLIPNPVLVFNTFKNINEFIFDGVSGVLSDNFIGILIR